MTLSEFKLALDRDLPLLTEEEMSNLFRRTQARNFPQIRRMRKRLVLEGLSIIVATGIASVISGMLTSGFAAIFFLLFAALFVSAEILGFIYYWQTPYAASVKESLEQYLRKLQRVTTAMKTLNVTLGLTLMGIVFVDNNFTNQVPVISLLIMLLVKIMAWIFSMKWISREKDVRRALEEMI